MKWERLPVEIQERMLDEQEAQGNKRNPDIFICSVSCDVSSGTVDQQ